MRGRDIVRCKFLGPDGVCTGKYSGYGCIKSSCASFKKAQNCEHREPVGDYCRKYARFGCVGRDSCKSITDYLEAIADEET